jgi:GTP pyrophosphokinase
LEVNLSYLELEWQFDHAVVFMATRASEAKTFPVASILHSIRVGLYLQQQGGSREVVLAGLLHDVVEDADATIDEVTTQFGEGVAKLVEAMTVDESLESEERDRESVDRCSRLGRDALFIKAADIADNLHFYISDANPQRLNQLAESLSYFLDASAKELAETDVWTEIRRQREVVLEMIGKKNNIR